MHPACKRALLVICLIHSIQIVTWYFFFFFYSSTCKYHLVIELIESEDIRDFVSIIQTGHWNWTLNIHYEPEKWLEENFINS